MLFTSIDFLIFFPVVCLLYFVIPPKLKNPFLLAASYYFYMCWNPKYALLMLASTLITWVSGILIVKGKEDSSRFLTPNRVVALSFILNLAILLFFKYINFFIHNAVHLINAFGGNVWEPYFFITLPVGISFYTFQALSYTMDVYRGETKAEKNFIDYALFVSFFPQLVAGPSERSKNLLHQVHEEHRFSFENMRRGLLQMTYGFFQKVVIAETAAIIVKQVYDNYWMYPGVIIVFATMLFAVQIYCDFGGYSNIARGAATVMGFSLMENFHNPYFADSVADFWRRWHISLSTWFRDYLYIPLGGNRKGKRRKYFNIMVVFITSGFWHGANWTYVVWGALNGIFQVIGDMLKPVRKRVENRLHIRREAGCCRLLRVAGVFLLVDFTWLFFRAKDIRTAIDMLRSLVTDFRFRELFDGTLLTLGLSLPELVSFGFSLLILLTVDILKEHRVEVIEGVISRKLMIRWIIYLSLFFYILIFGIYGPLYDASQFIYFRF